MRRIIIIEEDDNEKETKRVGLPYRRPSWQDGYICPICGKHVGSMEVHPCNQPYCKGTYA